MGSDWFRIDQIWFDFARVMALPTAPEWFVHFPCAKKPILHGFAQIGRGPTWHPVATYLWMIVRASIYWRLNYTFFWFILCNAISHQFQLHDRVLGRYRFWCVCRILQIKLPNDVFFLTPFLKIENTNCHRTFVIIGRIVIVECFVGHE